MECRVVSPPALPGFTASADIFGSIEGCDRQHQRADIVNRCFEGVAEYAAAYSRSEQSGARSISRQPFNFASIKVRGIGFRGGVSQTECGGDSRCAALRRAISTIATKTRIPGKSPSTVGVNGIRPACRVDLPLQCDLRHAILRGHRGGARRECRKI